MTASAMPQIIILKFGGKLLCEVQKMQKIPPLVQKWKEKGFLPVIVVSAMGDNTDRLLCLSRQAGCRFQERETDLLLSIGEQESACLLSILLTNKELPSISFNAFQAGIIGQGPFGQGLIAQINTQKIEKKLKEGIIPVITGFQAWLPEKETVITLGRGGSDMTAVQLAAAFQCPCILYKDVDGVYTSDPKQDKTARLFSSLSYEKMKELCDLGAKVIMKEAVEIARQAHVPIYIQNPEKPSFGTVIGEKNEEAS